LGEGEIGSDGAQVSFGFEVKRRAGGQRHIDIAEIGGQLIGAGGIERAIEGDRAGVGFQERLAAQRHLESLDRAGICLEFHLPVDLLHGDIARVGGQLQGSLRGDGDLEIDRVFAKGSPAIDAGRDGIIRPVLIKPDLRIAVPALGKEIAPFARRDAHLALLARVQANRAGLVPDSDRRKRTDLERMRLRLLRLPTQVDAQASGVDQPAAEDQDSHKDQAEQRAGGSIL